MNFNASIIKSWNNFKHFEVNIIMDGLSEYIQQNWHNIKNISSGEIKASPDWKKNRQTTFFWKKMKILKLNKTVPFSSKIPDILLTMLSNYESQSRSFFNFKKNYVEFIIIIPRWFFTRVSFIPTKILWKLFSFSWKWRGRIIIWRYRDRNGFRELLKL